MKNNYIYKIIHNPLVSFFFATIYFKKVLKSQTRKHQRCKVNTIYIK